MLLLDFASFKLPPSPRVIRVLKAKLKTINEYPNESYLQLKEKLADVYKLNTQNIFLGNGLDEVIDLITRAFVRETRVRQSEAYFSIILGLSYLFSTQSFPEKPKSCRHANYN